MLKETQIPKLSKNDINMYPSFYTDTGDPVSGFSIKVNFVLEKGTIYDDQGDLLATRTDLKSIPSNYFSKNNIGKSKDSLNKKNKIIDLLKEELGIEAFQQENIQETLKNISLALGNAKMYLTEYLGIPLPKDILQEKIKTSTDLINFLKKTRGLKPDAKIGLSPFYCAITQVMRAEIEYQKGEFDLLEKEAEWLGKVLFAETKEENELTHFIKTGKRTDELWDQIVIVSDDVKQNPSIAQFNSRGKTHERAITKMLAKIQFNKKEAINDGIGLRFEVMDDVEIKELIPFLARHFKEKFGATHLECRDNNFLLEESEEYREMFEELLDNEDVIFNPQYNPATNKNYQAIDLKGYLRVTENKKQSFELQIVRLGNKNEDGMSRHEIYEPLQKMIVVSRLFGSFSEKYLDLLVTEAAKNTGFSKEKIKEYYLERSLVEIKSKGRNRKIKSFATKRSLKLKENGLLPERLSVKSKAEKN